MSILKIAHRGASGYAPENTFTAFDKAVELDVDMIECDIRLCKSGELVVIHDKTVDRTTNGQGRVLQFNLTNLKRLTTREDQKIPTLEEVFARYKNKVGFFVDVKSLLTTKKLFALVKKHNLKEKIIITSTIHPLLAELRLRDKNLILATAFTRFHYFRYWMRKMILLKNFFVYSAKIIKTQYLSVYYRFVDQKLVDLAHKNKLKILVFPPNGKETIDYFKSIRVDGVISDYPDRI